MGFGLTTTERVPAERRLFGLDRRSLLPALIVIGLAVFWTLLIPFVNSILTVEQTTRAGEVFALGPGLTMDVQEGWEVDAGLRTTDRTRSQSDGGTVVLYKDGVNFVVAPGSAPNSDLRTLLSQIEKVRTAQQGREAFNVSGDVQAFRTDDGQRGLAQGYTTVDGAGVVAALKFQNTGLSITATGPDASMLNQADDLELMIDSISYDSGAGN